MRFKFLVINLFLFIVMSMSAQDSKMKKFKRLSCSEKCWVVYHPFVAKKALKITEEVRKVTKLVIEEGLLRGDGNSGQVDAFRHAFWMANLTQEIGWRKAKKLGEAHEKGNYKDYKKYRLEDGIVPDKISSEMDFFNNNVGIEIGKKSSHLELKKLIIETVLQGKCKIIKQDKIGNYLDCDEKIISREQLKGKWENNKCLVNSNHF